MKPSNYLLKLSKLIISDISRPMKSGPKFFKLEPVLKKHLPNKDLEYMEFNSPKDFDVAIEKLLERRDIEVLEDKSKSESKNKDKDKRYIIFKPKKGVVENNDQTYPAIILEGQRGFSVITATPYKDSYKAKLKGKFKEYMGIYRFYSNLIKNL